MTKRTKSVIITSIKMPIASFLFFASTLKRPLYSISWHPIFDFHYSLKLSMLTSHYRLFHVHPGKTLKIHIDDMLFNYQETYCISATNGDVLFIYYYTIISMYYIRQYDTC